MMEVKQKDLKELAEYGKATDLTNTLNLEDLEKEEVFFTTIACSYGIYGCNGCLFQGWKSRKLYVITERNTNVFQLL